MKNVVAGLFPKRSVFDLTHDRKLSCDMGMLVPILIKDCLPGDTWQIEAGSLLRFAPMPAPVMHRFNVFFHYWFVPNRLTWDNWDKFITHGETGTDNPTAPYMNLVQGDSTIGSLSDYMGLPVTAPYWATSGGYLNPNALPFRAYALIYNEWYRDEWLQSKITMVKTDGVDTQTGTNLLRRNWEKDYFTACLPDTQKGTEVTFSLGTSADVTIDNANHQLDIMFRDNSSPYDVYSSNYPVVNYSDQHMKTENGGIPDDTRITLKGSQTSQTNTFDQELSGTADLSTAQAITMSDLRLGIQLQKWQERNARAGSRYREALQAHFGVVVPDFRLQRPEFIGGGKVPVTMNSVLQTSATSTGSPQGNMAGHGIALAGVPRIRYSCVEHGFIIGIMSIMPKTAYQQGLEKMWSRPTRYDYYWPEFAHLSEQPVKNKELYCLGGAQTANDDAPFGYRGFGDEYRMAFSQVCGDFRTTMDYWHDGRIFSGTSPIPLNGTFLECDPDKRIFSDENASDMSCWLHILHSIKALRPMPVVADPGLMDHF